MMDVTESETFRNFTVFNKNLFFLNKLNKSVVQSASKYIELFQNSSYDVSLQYSAWCAVAKDCEGAF